MAIKGAVDRKSVHKRTKQGGLKKTSTMNKSERRSNKKYRGQGR